MEDEALPRWVVLLCLGMSGVWSLLGDPLLSLLSLSVWAILVTLCRPWASGRPFQLPGFSLSTSFRVQFSLSSFHSYILWNKSTPVLWGLTATKILKCQGSFKCSRNLKMMPTTVADGLPFSVGPLVTFHQTSNLPLCLLPPRCWPACTHWSTIRKVALASSYPQSPCCHLQWPAFLAALT